jgi:hypothetical protein
VWAFLELSSLLATTAPGFVVQHSFLRNSSRGATFQLGGEKEVYFNYYGERLVNTTPLTSKVITNAHVEWFIQDLLDYRRSAIIDTKYSKWNAGQCRNAMGYLTEFDVTRGAVIFRDRIPHGALNATEAAETWAVCHLPDAKKIFFVGCLIPAANAEQLNRETLTRMAAALGIESKHTVPASVGTNQGGSSDKRRIAMPTS